MPAPFRRFRVIAATCVATFCLTGAAPLSEQDARVQLGRRLFYDADLSADGSMSCATCHEQRHAFADGNSTHPGVTDEPGVRNVPSLGNVGSFVTLTWIDQHISALEKQFFTPLMGHTPVEMGMPDRQTLTGRIAGDACYRRLFARSFPQEQGRIDPETIAAAVAAFERTLISKDSLWDQAQQGRATISDKARRGDVLFRSHCSSCHSGSLFTDQKFHLFATTAGTRVRTPSLRNVSVTAPYWHDGSAVSLKDAILRHPDTASLTSENLTALEAFLETLTDQHFLHNPSLALPEEECPL